MGQLKLERWERWALIALMALALALRLYKLNAPLWFDEIMPLVHFVRQPVGHLIGDYSSFNNHLFYSLQAKLFVTLFGEQPWALRLPAVAFGVAGVWALWRLARPALGPWQALLAAALLALSYHHIWFSQNARGYTELMFWQLAALILFVEGLGSTSWKTWGLFGITLAAAMYTHMTAAFFVAALGLVYLAMLAARLFAPRALPEAFLAPGERAAQIAPFAGFVWGGVLTLILCSPALAQMGHLVGAVKSSSEVDVMQEYQNPLWTLAEGLRTLVGPGSGPTGVLTLIAALGAALVCALGAAGLWRRQPIVAATSLLHIALTLVALTAMSMRLWPRFFFTDLAFVMLFLTQGAFLLAKTIAPLARRLLPATTAALASEGRLFTAAAAVMLLASAALAARNYALPKQNFPGPIAYLAALHVPAESVGAVGLAADAYADYLRPGWRKVESVADLAALEPSAGRRWVVIAFPGRTSRKYAEVSASLGRDFEIVRRFPGTLGDGGIWLFRGKASTDP